MKKKILIALLLLGSASAVAIASFSGNRKKTCSRTMMMDKKNCCKHSCPYQE